MAAHSSVLLWKIPWTEGAVHGVASVGYDLVTKQQQDTHKFTSLPVFDVQFSGITYIQSLVQTSLLIYHPKRKLCPH